MTDAASDSLGKVFLYGEEHRGVNGTLPPLRAVPVLKLGDVLTAPGAWVLFVGRKETATEVGARLHEVRLRPAQAARRVGYEPASRQTFPRRLSHPLLPGSPIALVATTTQKQALRVLRRHAPFFVMLETEAKPDSRARFGRILRTRLAETKLVAVGPRPPEEEFAFDAHWEPPFAAESLVDLLQRMREGGDTHVVQRGPIRLDLLTRTVVTPKGSHHMTPKQCALLHLLLDHHDRLVSRRDIMRTIWDTTFMEDTRTLDVHIRWLRQFIEPDPSDPIYLRTVRGKGYHLCLEG